MKRSLVAGLSALTVCALYAATPLDASRAAAVRIGNTVTKGCGRFRLLTDRMVRCEWSADGAFEDRPSLVFINREMPDVDFTIEERSDGILLKTSRMTLEWTGGAFDETNLTVNGVAVLTEDDENLLGTTRTLDRVTCFADLMPTMEKGLLSRRGVTVVDDTLTPLFVNAAGSSFGKWVEERPPREKDAYRDLTIFAYGHDYKGCLGDYVKVAGPIPLPPRWAFGYWWSRYWLYTDKEIRDLVDKMLSVGYPLDVFIIDMEWHETWNIEDRPDRLDEFGQRWGWTGYTWNRDLFPNPDSTLAYLHGKGCKTALNLHPASGIQPVEECYDAFCRDYGWKGTNAVPFRADEEKWAACYFKNVIAPLEEDGVDFWWLDWQQWKLSKDKPSLSNTFWLNYIFNEHSRQRGGRPFIYHRWGGLGSHRYQVGFSGDIKVSWDALATIPWFTATASNVGYGYWGHDIGGHASPDGNDGLDGELFTRWLQSGVFTPIFKTHSTKNAMIERRIWKYPDHFDALRDALDLRYRLAPYVYTAARQAYDTGVSICRPMYYDSPEDERAYRCLNQYMFGDDILAVTVTNRMAQGENVSKTQVFLPEGTWYDVASGELIQGGCLADRTYAIDQNPWFIRAGAIIPLYPKTVRNLAHVNTDEMELLFAPGAEEGECEVYEDGGDNPDYPGNFAKTRVVRKGGRVVIGPRTGSYALRFPCLSKPLRVSVNGVSTPWSWEASDFSVVVRTPHVDGSRETVVDVVFSEDTSIEDSRLVGMRGRQREIDALTEEFKRELRNIKPAMNLPKSWQKYWQAPAAIAESPLEMDAILRSREISRLDFLDKDLPRYEEQLSPQFVCRLKKAVAKSADQHATVAVDGLPLVDISGETNRHSIVSAGTKNTYQGHPTTILSDDGKRLFCVWTLNHGGECGPAAESLDGGLTWKRVDARLPPVYAATHMNCPTLQKAMTPEGCERWLAFSRKGEWIKGARSPGMLGVMASDDCGATWRETGVFNLPAAMPPTGFIRLKDGSYALFGQERVNPEVQNDGPADDQVLWMSVSHDGGITWGGRRTVASANSKNLCEPFALRSPGGDEIGLLIRENRRSGRSMMCFSCDEGKTWTKPEDTCAGLTGDRHEGVQLPDGRWVIAHRDMLKESPTYGHYVAWVGTYDDIRHARPGQYRIKLLHSYAGDATVPGHTWNGDCGYSGVELLPDGTIVCTTYVKYWPDVRKHSVVSVRFRIEETDAIWRRIK